MKRNFLIYLTLALFLVGCSSGGDNASMEDSLVEEPPKADEPKKEMVNDQLSQDIEELIYSLPSPVEMTSLIQASGAEYTDRFLNPSDNYEKYATNYHKALNLGVYGADLGYMNIYDQSLASLKYMSIIKNLADDLKVGNYFDFRTLKRLAEARKDGEGDATIDSLLYVTTRGFRSMDQYLRENQRGNLSILILAGTWLEGIYIATKVANQSGNADIIERIGEQKEALNNLISLLEIYKSDKKVASLIQQLQPLVGEYDKVEILITDNSNGGEMVFKEDENGNLVFEDTSTSEVKIADEQLKNISTRVAEIRNNIIQAS